MDRAAIRYHHTDAGNANPADNEGVRRVLRGLTRRAACEGRTPGQAAALTDDGDPRPEVGPPESQIPACPRSSPTRPSCATRPAAQEHSIDLCRLLGEPTPAEASIFVKWPNVAWGPRRTGIDRGHEGPGRSCWR